VPVNRSVSLLRAWFRLVYTVIALFGLLNLVTVYRLLSTPDYLTAFGSGQLHAQAMLLLNSYRYDWSMSLVIFGIHLGLLGYLIYRSGYVPKIYRDSAGNRRIGLGDRSLEAIPLSEHTSAIHLYHVLHGANPSALALDQGVEAPGADSAIWCRRHKLKSIDRLRLPSWGRRTHRRRAQHGPRRSRDRCLLPRCASSKRIRPATHLLTTIDGTISTQPKASLRVNSRVVAIRKLGWGHR
jgi:Domain of unknown function (DUF4386)